MRLGLVGYGTGGQHFHGPFIEAVKGIQLVGIVARAADKIAAAKADFPDVPVFESLDSMMASVSLDAVTVTTPPHTRRELVLKAIEAGLHVVADKPFAPNAEVARELTKAAQDRGVVLSVFHNRRFDTDIVTFKKTLESGVLGQVWRFQSRFDLDDPVTLEKGLEGGLLRDLGSHVVDQAIHLFGSVASVNANLDNMELPEGTTNTSFCITLNHKNGVHSHLSASKVNGLVAKEILVYAENGGYHSLATDVQAQDIFAGKRPVEDLDGWGYQDEAHWALLATPEEKRTVPSEQGRYHDYYQQFYDAVTQGKTPPVTCEEAIEVLKVIDAVSLSAAQNQCVSID